MFRHQFGYGVHDMGKPITILFGTQSGNSEDLADQAGSIAKEHGMEPKILGMDECTMESLSKTERILIICSTWGEGDMPDNAEDLWESASADDAPRMENTYFSVLALGDSSYTFFCQSGIDWDNRLEELGATRVADRIDCDVEFDDEFKQWVEVAMPAISSVGGEVSLEEVVVEEVVVEEVEKTAEVDTIELENSDSKEWSSKNPYFGEMSENRLLNGEGATKETRHFVFQLGDSGLDYTVGDAIGLIPQNHPYLVDELIATLGASPDDEVSTSKGNTTLYQALLTEFEIHQVRKKFVKSLDDKIEPSKSSMEVRIVKRTNRHIEGGEEVEWNWSGESDDYPEGYAPGSVGDSPSEKIKHLCENDEAIDDYIWSRDYVDVLNDFPSLSFSPQEFVDSLSNSRADLKGRLYSIASSVDAHPGEVHLTVGIVRYEHHDRKRTGLCTGYLADQVKLNETPIGMYMHHTKSFLLPEDTSTDIIMVGPGTGIAPFRAYLEQREMDGGTGKNWLFFGDQSQKTEYYYKEEIEAWLENGNLWRYTTAWSRDQEYKIYVQNRMAEYSAEIWEWMSNGAYFYVCGDKNYMAKDVHNQLIEIFVTEGGMSPEDAKDYVERVLMKEEKRYLRDVY